MSRDEKLELLRTVPLFRGIGGRELQRLGELTDEVDLPAGKVLMTQGERGDQLIILVDGAAEITRDGQRIRESRSGEVLGEIALLDGGPRTATVTLSEPSRLLVLARREFHALMDEFPSIRLQVLASAAERLRALERDAIH